MSKHLNRYKETQEEYRSRESYTAPYSFKISITSKELIGAYKKLGYDINQKLREFLKENLFPEIEKREHEKK